MDEAVTQRGPVRATCAGRRCDDKDDDGDDNNDDNDDSDNHNDDDDNYVGDDFDDHNDDNDDDDAGTYRGLSVLFVWRGDAFPQMVYLN